MKKLFLFLGAALLSLSASAQKMAKVQVPVLQNAITMSAPTLTPVMAPMHKTLKSGEMYMAPFSSDTYTSEGMGLTGYPGTYQMVEVLPVDVFSNFDGALIKGMRVAFADTFGAPSTLEVWGLNIPETSGDITHDVLASKATSGNAVKGWNQVTFDTNPEIDYTKYNAIGLVYSYVQTNSNYPISLNQEGMAFDAYLYGTINNQTGFFDIGLASYGNLAVQAIVEKADFPKTSVVPVQVESTVYAKPNEVKDVQLAIMNTGSEKLTSVSYTVGTKMKTSEEKTITFKNGLTSMGAGYITVQVTGEATDATVETTITITKVNGQANLCKENSINLTVATMSTQFTKRVAVEEFTGTGCGYCPRGIIGMQLLREQYPDTFVGIGIHQYNSTDYMYINTSSYARLSFSGAPGCMLNRGTTMDPYYGSGNNERGIFDEFDAELKVMAPVGVEVSGSWVDEEKTQVKAKAVIEGMSEGTYGLEFVVIGDSVYNASKKQSNYYSQYTAAQGGQDMAIFCKGGEKGQSSVTWAFDDVALCSSYLNGTNQQRNITVKKDTPTEVEYILDMPTKAALVQSLNYNKINVIALVTDTKTGKIVNCAKSAYLGSDTGIEVVANEVQQSVSRNVYNLAGQRVSDNARGLVIVNGKKVIR